MRRGALALFAAAGLIVPLATGYADDYPNRHVTLIAPWPAAGAIDTLCRELAPGLGDRLGQPVIVEDRPGAGSTIGTADGAKAVPDGYTLVMAGSGSLAISRRSTKPGLRPADGFFTDCTRRQNPVRAGGQSVSARANGRRPHQIREGASGVADLWVRRRRFAASPLCRTVQEHDRHRDDACTLQGHRAGADRR